MEFSKVIIYDNKIIFYVIEEDDNTLTVLLHKGCQTAKIYKNSSISIEEINNPVIIEELIFNHNNIIRRAIDNADVSLEIKEKLCNSILSIDNYNNKI